LVFLFSRRITATDSIGEREAKMKIKAWVLGALALAMTGIAAKADGIGGGGRYAVVNDWSGFYAGATLGFSHTSMDSTFSPCYLGCSISASDTQFTGGLLAGYNWQSGNNVWGIEGDISGLSDWDYLASIRARYGIVSGNWLYYGTAGAAFINSGNVSGFGISVSGPSFVGLAVGAGAETKINSHLTAGVEGIYYWFPDDTQTVCCGASVKTNVDVLSIRARLTYKFDGTPEFLK
jgi:outer membrane immunogenic protein